MSSGLWVSTLLLGLPHPCPSFLSQPFVKYFEMLRSNLLLIQNSINQYFVLFCHATQSINPDIYSVPVLPQAPTSGKR